MTSRYKGNFLSLIQIEKQLRVVGISLILSSISVAPGCYDSFKLQLYVWVSPCSHVQVDCNFVYLLSMQGIIIIIMDKGRHRICLNWIMMAIISNNTNIPICRQCSLIKTCFVVRFNLKYLVWVNRFMFVKYLFTAPKLKYHSIKKIEDLIYLFISRISWHYGDLAPEKNLSNSIYHKILTMVWLADRVVILGSALVNNICYTCILWFKNSVHV